MSWRDTQRFMKIASAVRGLGWTLGGLSLALGAFTVLDSEGDDALFVVRFVAVSLVVLLGVTHAAAWFIEKHAERVVVR